MKGRKMPIFAAYIVPHPPLAVPEVGRGEERAISNTIAGYEEVARRIASMKPDTIVIISPHTAYYGDWIFMAGGRSAHGDLSQFRAGDVRIDLTYDIALRAAIEQLAQSQGIPAGVVSDEQRPLDHGMMVPLYYLDREYPSSAYEAVSIGGSAVPREKLLAFGRCIAQAAQDLDRRCVLLVSGDLSHKLKADGPYGFDPAGPRFDEQFEEVVTSGDPIGFAEMDEKMCEDAAECGLSGFIMMAGALEQATELSGKPFTSELLSHEGPFGVGYGVAAYEHTSELPEGEVAADDTGEERVSAAQGNGSVDRIEDPLVKLAVETVNSYVDSGSVPKPPVLPPDDPDRAGCFVSIHVASTGDLRGCIGTIEATQPTLAQEIIANAISASTRDPRFPAIRPEELFDLRINVDVLKAAEPATIDMLDPARYGVIVTQGFRRGLLLPDLEGVDTVEEQLSIACMKAGISPSPGFSDVEIERFEVVRHE